MTKELMKKTTHAFFFLVSLGLFTGCANHQQLAIIKGPDAAKLGHKPSLYIIVERNKRLPEEFTAVLKQLSQEALPDFRLVVNEGNSSDKEIAQSDWVMTVRATRVIPNYTFKPFDNNALNGVNDCVVGAAVVGLSFLPCNVDGDTDFLEASIRDAHSKTLKTYTQEEAEGGFTLLPPLTYLTGLDQKTRWEQMIHGLYAKIEADQSFANAPMPY